MNMNTKKLKQQRDASLYLLKQEQKISQRFDLMWLYWWILGICTASMIWLIGLVILR